MDERSLKALEFDKIRETVAAYAFSELGARRSRAMAPAPAVADVMQAEAAELAAHARVHGDIPLEGLNDVGPLLKRLGAEGILVGAEFIALARFLEAAARSRKALADPEKYPHLYGYADAVEPLRPLVEQIRRQIDDDGAIRDDATPLLASLRKKIAAKEAEIQQTLDRLLDNATVRRSLRDAIITQRNGRYVLPVRTDALGSVRGIVHGHSNAGVTAFVEPMAVVEINNQLEALRADAEAEEERILRQLSFACTAETTALETDLDLMSELDFIAARAGFGLAYYGCAPRIVDEPRLELRQARHPVLLATRPFEQVVPIDVNLGGDWVGLIISGPNNGGKTVALKTVGLLTAMALAGVPIPAREGSEVGRFDKIRADIGDESSLEGNLSTFTAHMANVGRFLADADGRTLLLLDELGVGTSPKYGVAIAAAVLRRLRRAGAKLVCTTHYDELKVFAFDEPGFLNACVETDAATLKPTYVLKMGIPGTSEAFAILARLAFPDDVMKDAAATLGSEETSLAGLIRTMEEREAAAAALAGELEGRLAALERDRRAFDAEREQWEIQEARRRAGAYAEAARILKDARRQASTVIRELREQSDTAAAEALRRDLIAAEKEAAASHDEIAAGLEGDAEPVAVTVGEWVGVRGTAAKGKVLEADADRGQARVRFGGVEAWVAFGDLTAAAEPPKRARVVTPDAPDVSPSLNVIGATVEEALGEVARYLDQAELARLPSVEIIHGHGTGRLREGVRAYLRGHPAVASFGPGANNNQGVTVVQLKD